MLRIKDLLAGGALVGLALSPLLVGCGGHLAGDLPEAVVHGPELPASQRQEPAETISTMLTDLGDIETVFASGPVEPADQEILFFRLDRLIADFSDAMSGGTNNYEVHVGLGRALTMSQRLGRPGAGVVALHMFEQAIIKDSLDAGAWYYKGLLEVEMGQASAGAVSLQSALERTNASDYPELRLQLALAHSLAGQNADAMEVLRPFVTENPGNETAQQLMASLESNDPRVATGSISLGMEGRSLVSYEVRGATWRVVHETLGFKLGLPVSWQIVEENIDENQGGYVQCAAPPMAGSNRQWRSDTMTVWVVPLDAGSTIDSLVAAYSDSYEDLGDISVADSANEETRILEMTRTPFMGDPLHGRALVRVTDGTGYVVEFWGDAVSYMISAPQVVAIMDTFEPITAESPLASVGR